MSKFYTNVSLYRNDILLRGYENGKRFQQTIPYRPYVFVPSRGNIDTPYRNLKGQKFDKMEFPTISEASNFVNEYKDYDNFSIYGLSARPHFVYTFIRDHFPGNIEYDPKVISVVSLDIETASDDGFPDIATANKEVIAITVRRNGKSVVLGCHPYNVKDDSVTYMHCSSERDLLEKFIQVWRSEEYNPDVLTGWNVEFFDIPYLVNRIKRELGDVYAKKLSPWNVLNKRKVTIVGREHEVYDPAGVTILDYMQLYRKFTFVMQESYKLDHIAHVELGERKIDYSDEYESLHDLYEKNFDLFIDYNIKDVVLVDRLDEKLKLIEQVYALAYDGKVNFQDTFTSVRMWDIIIHNYLMDKNIVVPPIQIKEKERQIMGAYVKDPQVGMHKWVVSFDLNSLYPHLIMQYNISPETFVDTISSLSFDDGIDRILDGALNDMGIRNELEAQNVTVAASGCMFDKDRIGFLPELMQKMYDDRVVYKKLMLEAKQRYEHTHSYEDEKAISANHNMQLAKKIQLNSAYGALGNNYFRWFDPKFAESITKSGQLSIKWIERKMNAYLNKLFNTENEDYVLACDTDSMYITLDRLVDQVFASKRNEYESESDWTAAVVAFLDRVCEQKLEPFIDKGYEELAEYVNAYGQKMTMKREAIANKGIWTAKKRYILNVYNNEGVQYSEPKLKMMGIEAVRSSTPSAVRTKIKEALGIIMNQTEDDLIKFIDNFRQEFKTLPFEDVAFPRGCKGLSTYSDAASIFKKGTPIHVKGALLFNNELKKKNLLKKYQPVYEGEKVKFCYLKVPNPLREHVVATTGELPKELELDKYIDYDTQFEKAFLDPLSTVVNAIGWHTEKQMSLEAFWQ